MTKIKEIKNKYNEDKMVILYPSPSNLFKSRWMEFLVIPLFHHYQ